MKSILSILFVLSLASAGELVYVSNDTSSKSLETLEETYKQVLFINEKGVYLIPSDCRLERYYGGASQSPLQLAAFPQQAQKLIITQEVFKAKDQTVIIEKIEVEKSIALVEGKISKAFLEDKEGRGFGGASEVPLDFSFQKIAATQTYMKPQSPKIQEKVITKEEKPYRHPRCELLEDGSGYSLEGTAEARLYKNGKYSDITDSSILFE